MSSHFRTFGAPLLLFASLIPVGLLAGCPRQSPPVPASSHATAPVAALPEPVSTSSAERIVTIFVPGGDGKLHPSKFRQPQHATPSDQWEESPLALLFRKTPRLFPEGTRLVAPITKNKQYNRQHPGSEIYTVFEVRLNREFLTSQLWSDPETARLAFDAIIKTATNSINESRRPTYPFAIHVLVGGKTVTRLGKTKVRNPA